MILEELKDKSITLIVWNSEKENDVHVYLGKLHLEDDDSYFVNEEQGWKLSLNEEELSRLKPVSDDLKGILLNADYSITMSMSSLPDKEETNDFKATGIKWHK